MSLENVFALTTMIKFPCDKQAHNQNDEDVASAQISVMLLTSC